MPIKNNCILKLSCLFLICLICESIYAQNSIHNNDLVEIKTISRAFNSEDAQELEIKVKSILLSNNDEGVFLVRLCSNELFIKTIPFAKTPIQNVEAALRFGGTKSSKQIYYSRSSKCGVDELYTLKLLYASSKDHLKGEDEIYNLCQVVSEFNYAESYKKYKLILQRLKNKLINNESGDKAIAIYGVYNKRPSKLLTKRLLMTKNLLRKEVLSGQAKILKSQVNSTDINYVILNSVPLIYFVQIFPSCQKQDW